MTTIFELPELTLLISMNLDALDHLRFCSLSKVLTQNRKHESIWRRLVFKDLVYQYNKRLNGSWYDIYRLLKINKAKVLSLALVGNSGTGKTAFLTRYQTGDFVSSHISTLTPKTISINSVKGVILLITDYPPDQQPATWHGSVAIFRAHNKNSYKIETAIPHIFNVFSFADTPAINFLRRVICAHRTCLISAKSNFNFDKPILEVLNFYK